APSNKTGLHTKSARNGHIVERIFSQIAVEDGGVVGEMRFQDVQIAVQVEIPDANSHSRLFVAIFVQSDAAFEADVFERAVVVIAEQEAWRGITGDVDIGPAVVIEIRGHGSHHVATLGLGDSRRPAYIAESTVSIVVIECSNAGRQSSWSTHHRSALP